MNYVELAIPFFILAMALEFFYGWISGRQTYHLSDTLNSLHLGVLSRLVDLLKLGFASAALGSLADLAGLPQWPMDTAWQWVAAFVAYDFLYYWKHRYGHEWRIFWASHAAHHQSEEFNLSTALRQTGTDYIGFVFYIPLFLAGVPAEVVLTVGSLNLIYQFWVHTEHIRRLGPLEWVLVTPSNHRVHHARNPRYIDRNYAGVFIIWDRLFGTFQDERPDDPCVYGVTKALHSWNPLWANAQVWYEGLQLMWHSPRWRDKLLLWFKSPGWTPSGMTISSTGPTSWQYPRFDPPASTFARGYTFVQFWLITIASLWLLTAHNSLPRTAVLAALAWLSFSMFVQGTWLEGRRHAATLEWMRLAAALLLALLSYSMTAPLYLTSVLIGYVVVSALVVLGAQLLTNSLHHEHQPTSAA